MSSATDAKRDLMLAFWSERAERYGSSPEANTNDVWVREVEIPYVDRVVKEVGSARVLDFGCANGFSTLRLAEANPQSTFLGVDLNGTMIDAAQRALEESGLPNAAFRRLDVLEDPFPDRFDLVAGVRVFQNIESVDAQRQVLDRLLEQVDPGGTVVLIETYADAYERINADRADLALPPLPIHPHLTLLTEEFDEHVDSRTDLVRREWVTSSYYFVTRLVYSKLAAMTGEPIDYNHPLHQIAAILPNIGDYGPEKATVSRVRGGGGA